MEYYVCVVSCVYSINYVVCVLVAIATVCVSHSCLCSRSPAQVAGVRAMSSGRVHQWMEGKLLPTQVTEIRGLGIRIN